MKTISIPCLALMVAALAIPLAVSAVVDGPGDYKEGYEGAEYRTRSISLDARTGYPADLLTIAERTPTGLPDLPVPADNPLSRERIALGRKLFFDRRLSLNGTQSCAMCHIPEQGFTNNELATAVGFEGRDVGRNAPTLYNVAYMRSLFHDGRENTLEQQAWQPMINPKEMANPSIGRVIALLESLPDYAMSFERAFAGRGPGIETVARALAAYQRTLVSGNSRFDRWYFGGERDALTESEIRGFELFTGRGMCSACHLIESDHALFTDHDLHNTGTGFSRSMKRSHEARRVLLAPGVWGEIAPEAIAQVSAPAFSSDLGHYRITGNPDDRWKFRTPGLRNVALTAPYMHDGSLRTLTEVVAFYDRGGEPNPLQDPRIMPLGLGPTEQQDLVAFLGSLTGDYRELVLDAFAAPVGERSNTHGN